MASEVEDGAGAEATGRRAAGGDLGLGRMPRPSHLSHVSRPSHPDIVAHDDYVAEFGPTGGWHPDDHASWVRVLRLCKGDAAVAVEVAEEEMVGFSREEIIAHARWHAELDDLAYRKRAAVASWRLQMDRQKEERVFEVRPGG